MMACACRSVLVVGAVIAVACGGRVGAGEGDDGGSPATDGGSGNADSAQGADAPIPVSEGGTQPLPEAGPPGLTCTATPSGGSSGAQSCESQVNEGCSDGTTYMAQCSCPAATCNCFMSSEMGGSSGGVPYEGCPTCPGVDQLWAICNFPH